MHRGSRDGRGRGLWQQELETRRGGRSLICCAVAQFLEPEDFTDEVGECSLVAVRSYQAWSAFRRPPFGVRTTDVLRWIAYSWHGFRRTHR